jgi:hypothetical protein
VYGSEVEGINSIKESIKIFELSEHRSLYSAGEKLAFAESVFATLQTVR